MVAAREDIREAPTVGSLFTGIGGLDLAVGGDHAWMCEYDQHCRGVLERRFPGIPCYPDVRELGGDTPDVDILVGGYPCQPFSVAGKRGGDTDPRHLWPEFARLIRVLRPSVVVAENVAGHLRLGFHGVLADLASLGMDVRWGVVRASDVGAPHQRARLFVVATDPGRERLERGRRADALEAAGDGDGWAKPSRHRTSSPDPDRQGREGVRTEPETRDETPVAHRDRASRQPDWGAYGPAVARWESILGRVAPRPTDDRGRLMPEFVEWMMGFPTGWTDGVSRTQRLKMLGNAVVPAQAALALELLTVPA